MAKDKMERVSALDRALQAAMGEGRAVGADDDPAKTKYPTLWDWLSRIYVGVGHVRQPATITLALGPSGVLVSIRDVDLGVSCGAVCPHLDGALSALEDALTADVPPIRSWGRKEPRLRKRGQT
jgi:hypothetical protein